MAILFHDGFEFGEVMRLPEWSNPSSLRIGTGTLGTTVRTGVNSAHMQAVCAVTITASAQVTCGYAFYPSATGSTLAQFQSDAGATTHLTLMHNSSGFFELRRGTSSGTIIATSTATIPLDQLRHIQVQATVADAGGTCIVKHEGVEVLNFTGDTRNAGTSTNIDRVGFQWSFNNARGDDLWIANGVDDTANTGRPDTGFLGDLKIEPLTPSGNGATNQFVGSDGNSTDNYLLVDENPANTSDYVGSATSGHRDLYAVNDLPGTSTSALSLRIGMYAAKSDAGAQTLKPAIRESGGTVTAGSAVTLSTVYGGYFDVLRNAKPGGGAWSVSDINGLQIGVELP